MICIDCGKIGIDSPICNGCNEKRRECCERTAERRALARDAYMAALGGLAARGDLSVTDTSEGASVLAIETVRRWDAFIAAVDAEGGE